MGLFSPFRFGLKEYLGYNVMEFKDNLRFVEMIVSRDGEMGGICPLFFDGAVCNFKELPLPTNKAGIEEVYNYLKALRGKTAKVFMLFSKIKVKKKKDEVFNFS